MQWNEIMKDCDEVATTWKTEEKNNKPTHSHGMHGPRRLTLA